MAPTLTSAFSEFLHSLTAIAGSLANSIIAVFTAILALCQGAILGLFSLGNSLVKLVLDVFQGLAGFVAGNFIIIAVLIGAYFVYQSRQGNRAQTRSIKS
ncbi:hypothetical protein PC9H_003900 [Pleurotus ostreatus]|uniref:Uncharacterized protein n=3 Tax=Pleurotus TaxID=5320 RepID=A0A067P2A6_PLEO1|nr:uncharacterized protein PC9H_003900 [Pleurotus ostreatus]KAF7437066.1 hypothetical protein PC9H_003900 [Pleurotus ostreatus]KAG9223039.1 hypothetical protein CCMSSC00406_0000272 [Pleurotus cornucopiae]KAJ8702911.1 hypothetical protein PTI98_001584 [Pleurotus ostreatus]KDQ30552.1 hypothetical protein PLEOSDRAFT_1088426 [Pleurotus ostreatus PC15]